MDYKIINEELKIASCRIADLTMEQVTSFLKTWNDGSNIGALTIFYDRENDYLVLNEDNEEIRSYLDITEAYLKADTEGRRKIIRESPDSVRETIRLIKEVEEQRFIRKWVDRARQNQMSNVDRLFVENVPCGSAYIAYRLGLIQGKRIERAKKTKH